MNLTCIIYNWPRHVHEFTTRKWQLATWCLKASSSPRFASFRCSSSKTWSQGHRHCHSYRHPHCHHNCHCHQYRQHQCLCHVFCHCYPMTFFHLCSQQQLTWAWLMSATSLAWPSSIWTKYSLSHFLWIKPTPIFFDNYFIRDGHQSISDIDTSR